MPAKTFSSTSPFTDQDWRELESLATQHHVVMRAFPRLQLAMQRAGYAAPGSLAVVLGKEQARIGHAVSFLAPICRSLEQAGNLIVIKSLNHWPDLGSDLDLYTDADPRAVRSILCDRFHARAENRSWGDRFANKWNFTVPGLPELVEIHIARLGQMGEQKFLGESLVARALSVERGGHAFRVPAPEDRIVISTLQRMFRHFYIRLCDIAEAALLIEQGALDYDYLRSLGELTGLWDGLATYLKIVVEYSAESGRTLSVPPFVSAAARFGNEQVRFRRDFLRIPILPQSAQLYAAELRKLLVSRQVASSLRLSLMPALATAAVLKQKLAGSDSGIW
ncbi:MAG TPA: hypothetical protein VMD99_13350 [Terriglobales bacterium]|nr:hypothetical protein [Terriglobales bacterium]